MSLTLRGVSPLTAIYVPHAGSGGVAARPCGPRGAGSLFGWAKATVIIIFIIITNCMISYYDSFY